MPLELRGALLGLGSILRLETPDASGLFVVLARGAFRPDQERSEVIPRYLVAPHPYGEASDQETFAILANAIEEVVFEGYTDAADTSFLENLLDQMANGRRTTKARAKQFTEALTEIPDAEELSDSEDPTRSSGDPFRALRKLTNTEDRRKKP
jgi:hypothetical protein